jgi:hypothetical protein
LQSSNVWNDTVRDFELICLVLSAKYRVFHEDSLLQFLITRFDRQLDQVSTDDHGKYV